MTACHMREIGVVGIQDLTGFGVMGSIHLLHFFLVTLTTILGRHQRRDSSAVMLKPIDIFFRRAVAIDAGHIV